MTDLTIIMPTPNLVPKKWAKFHKQKLLEAAGDNPIIIISKEPLDWGVKNLIQTEYGISNLYRQILRGAKEASTPFIAIAEDDTLYPKQHFQFRPTEPGFYYNLNRWQICAWGEPFYFHKPRPANSCMICSRDLLIKTLENRFKSVAEGDELPSRLCHECGTVKEALGYDIHEWKSFYTAEPVLNFCHIHGLNKFSRKRKTWPWPVRAYDIPVWGRAKDIRKKFQ